MQIKVKIEGLAVLKAHLAGKAKQVRFATAKALTKTGHSIRLETVKEMQAKLDRPTSYTTRQAMQTTKATKDNLMTRVGLGVNYESPSKGTPYAHALGHLFVGGSRRWKKMEGAFRRIGVLPAGWIIVPGDACPRDAYGNPSRALIVQLISYFNAFSEQGYRANMSDKRRAKLAGKGITEAGFKTINGVIYFISRGKGNWFGGRAWMNGRVQHLHPGIWAKSGTHGSDVKPILMFVKMGLWKKLIDLRSIAESVVAKEWSNNMTAALNDAMRTAR